MHDVLSVRPPCRVEKLMSYDEKYDVLEELGKGAFGVVKKCKNKKTGDLVAAKFIRKTNKSKKEVAHEVAMMNKLHHRQLIQIFDAYETERQLIIVMELVPGKELFEKIVEENYQLTEQQVVRYMKQILLGVQHMHAKNIVHLDLKPENILCMEKNPDTDKDHDEIKLIDFGLSRELKPGEMQSTLCGTAEFVAPEIIAYDPITVKADMWSIGVIAYVLLSGNSPFLGEDDNETYTNVTNGEYDFDDDDRIFDGISDEAKDFIDQCLKSNPKERLNVDESLDHPWLTKEEKSLSKNVLQNKSNLKRFVARRRWQRVMNAVKAVGRFSAALKNFAKVKNTQETKNTIIGTEVKSMASVNDGEDFITEVCEESRGIEEVTVIPAEKRIERRKSREHLFEPGDDITDPRLRSRSHETISEEEKKPGNVEDGEGKNEKQRNERELTNGHAHRSRDIQSNKEGDDVFIEGESNAKITTLKNGLEKAVGGKASVFKKRLIDENGNFVTANNRSSKGLPKSSVQIGSIKNRIAMFQR